MKKGVRISLVHNKQLNSTSTALLALCFNATLAQNNQLRSGGLAGRYIYLEHRLCMSIEKKVETIKTVLQYGVGVYIFFFVTLKAWVFIGFPIPDVARIQIVSYVLSQSILALVSQSMMVSAAIELAYMLFTPGPDEAVDPLILGIAGTALLVMSDKNAAASDSMLFDAIAVLLFAMALALLFYLRFMLTKWFPKQFGDNKESRNQADSSEQKAETAIKNKDRNQSLDQAA